MSNGLPNPVDRHVGVRIRTRRIMLGLSQTELGDAVGVSFQQIQKYERGMNRVSASVLYAIGDKLRVSISYFYYGYGGDDTEALSEEERESQMHSAYALLNSDQGLEVAMAIASIKQPEKRRMIIDMIMSLAED